MRSALLSSGGLALSTLPDPSPPPGGLLIALRACGVCGTDLEKVRGGYRATGRIGHEPAGVVRQVGEGVEGFRPGDRVFAHHHVPCYACDVCRAGAYTFCPTFQSTNLDPGGFSELFTVSRAHLDRGAVLPLPGTVSDEEGTFVEPLGCCLEAIAEGGPVEGRRVLIVGLGPIGQMYLRLLRAFGASWIGAADLSPRRRALGERGGADETFDPRDPANLRERTLRATRGLGPDLVVVATGAPAAIADACRIVRRGGTVNLFGLPEKDRVLDVELQDLYLRGVRLLPTYATTETGTSRALGLLAAGRVKVSDLVTHRFPLEQVTEAFAVAARTEEAVKVLVTASH